MLFKQRCRDTRECLWWRIERAGWQNRKQSMSLCAVCNFYPIGLPFQEHLWRKYMNQVELWWGRFRKCSSSRQSLNQWHKWSAQRQTLQLYETVHTLASSQNKLHTHTCKCSLSLIYVSVTSALIYICRCFKTMLTIILCRWAKCESTLCSLLVSVGPSEKHLSSN